MIILPCLSCNFGLRVLGEPREVDVLVGQQSEFWPDKYACPKCGASVTGISEAEAEQRVLMLMQLVTVTPQEALIALHGAGLPDERIASIEVLKELLEPLGIRFSGRQVQGAPRVLLDSLTLPDGTTLHFGSSALGAAVFRITPKTSFTQRVLHEQRA